MTMRGFHAIALTPFDNEGEILWDELERQCDWIARCGPHGLVWPVNNSEFTELSYRERVEGMRRIGAVVGKRIRCVFGVADVCTSGACDLSEAAVQAGADAVIAMPPWNLKLSSDEQIMRYYRRIADVAGDVPIMIQNLGVPFGSDLSSAFVLELCETIETVQYVKEERHEQARCVSELVAMTGDDLKGVFSGGRNLNITALHRRGCCGNMLGTGIPDVRVQVWNRMEAGDEAGARAIEEKVNVLERAAFAVQTLQGIKQLMVIRGLFRCSGIRGNPGHKLDEELVADLERALTQLEPWMRSCV